MSDDKTNRVPRDASRVSLTDDDELRYWTETMGVSAEELREALDAAGSNAAAVRSYFQKSG